MQTFDQRSAKRSAVALDGRCRTSNGLRDFIAIVDLTPEGCCIMMRQPILRKGQRVTLQPDSLAGLRAEVRWTKGDLAGLSFEAPLYGPVYEHLARAFERPAYTLPANGAYGEAPTVLPPSIRQRLLEQISRAEAASAAPVDERLRVYREPIATAARPPLRNRPSERVLCIS